MTDRPDSDNHDPAPRRYNHPAPIHDPYNPPIEQNGTTRKRQRLLSHARGAMESGDITLVKGSPTGVVKHATVPPADQVTIPVQGGNIRRVADSPEKRRAMLVVATVAAGAVVLDQVTKTIAAGVLAAGPAHVGILHLRLVANRGVFMGIFGLPIWLMTLLTLAVVAVAARAGWRGGPSPSLAYGLLSGGAVGNLIDRYLQRPEFPPNAVVDWLSFGGITFNLADVFIVAAVLLLLGQESRQPTTTVGVGKVPSPG